MKVFKIKVLVFITLLLPFSGYSQIGSDEYNKYWYYRHRLTSEFMVLGLDDRDCTEPSGYSIPAHGTFRKDFKIRWVDGTTDLGYYLGVLATEYRLLKDAGWNTEQTEKELFLAMMALERLDRKSLLWFYQGGNCNQNGYFIRDDVREDIFGINTVFDKYATNGNYSYSSDYLLSLDGANYPKTFPNWSDDGLATLTPDQILHLYEGLALINKCLENDVYGPTGYEYAFNARRIAADMATYLNGTRWVVSDERLRHPKYNMVFLEGGAFMVAKSAGFFTGKNSRFFLTTLGKRHINELKIMLDIVAKKIMYNSEKMRGDKDFTTSLFASAAAVGEAFTREGFWYNSQKLLDHLDGNLLYDLGYYNLLHSFLRNLNNLPADGKWDEHLIQAPCYGVTFQPEGSNLTSSHQYYRGEEGWVGANRWVRFSKRTRAGSGGDAHLGHGLDYMILYNLYNLYYKDKNPGLVSFWSGPPMHHLKLDGSLKKYFAFSSNNDMEISCPIDFVFNGENQVTATTQIVLKPGFTFKATTDKSLRIKITQQVNACGDPLDKYGNIINPPLKSGGYREAASEQEVRTTTAENSNERIKSTYKPIDEYLRERHIEINTKFDLSVSAYPNPSYGKHISLTFMSYKNEKVAIVLKNNLGKEVSSFGEYAIPSGTHEINISLDKTLKAGVYFLEINNGEDVQIIKQIIK